MFKASLLRQVSRASSTAARTSSTATFLTRPAARGLATTQIRRDDKSDDTKLDKHDEYSTAGKRGAFEHEGQFSRTDNTIRVEYPEEEDLPSS